MPAPRPTEHYLHGDGHVVIVPARVAAWLERRVALNRVRIDARGLDPEIDAVLGALRISALVWRSAATGTEDTTPPEPDATSNQWMSTTQAAIHLGITDRAVRKAIATGTLNAENTGGRWRIHRDDIAHYRATRPTGAHRVS
ncbi:helix-turn-helix domain-containing protein [Rhodococcus zopfii]|uniref:helix-turn-helix domain-containing protein n=1 Tax=Rhodococcus zopfii TaxID=43772 RepID=UPI0011115991|nr:helix-turn-helix domain-containing protein [Rhodococcus zopfii]